MSRGYKREELVNEAQTRLIRCFERQRSAVQDLGFMENRHQPIVVDAFKHTEHSDVHRGFWFYDSNHNLCALAEEPSFTSDMPHPVALKLTLQELALYFCVPLAPIFLVQHNGTKVAARLITSADEMRLKTFLVTQKNKNKRTQDEPEIHDEDVLKKYVQAHPETSKGIALLVLWRLLIGGSMGRHQLLTYPDPSDHAVPSQRRKQHVCLAISNSRPTHRDHSEVAGRILGKDDLHLAPKPSKLMNELCQSQSLAKVVIDFMTIARNTDEAEIYKILRTGVFLGSKWPEGLNNTIATLSERFQTFPQRLEESLH